MDDLKEIKKDISSMKTFSIAELQLLKEILLELKQIGRDIKSQHLTEIN